MPLVKKRAKASDIGLEGYSSGLVIANNATDPEYKLDVVADVIYLKNSDTPPKLTRFRGVSLTMDITKDALDGQSGMESGFTETADKMIPLWLAGKSDGASLIGIFASGYSSVITPDDYDFTRHIGSIRNGKASDTDFDPEGGSDFNRIYQTGRWVRYANRKIVVNANNPTTTTWQEVDLASPSVLVPQNARTALLICEATATGAAVATDIYLNDDNGNSTTRPGIPALQMPAINSLKMSSGIIPQQLTASQKFYYRFTSADANAPDLTIYLVGYVLDI